jgi:hypothetical protein
MDELERIARIIIAEAPGNKPLKSYEIPDDMSATEAYHEGERYIMWTVARMLQKILDNRATATTPASEPARE